MNWHNRLWIDGQVQSIQATLFRLYLFLQFMLPLGLTGGAIIDNIKNLRTLHSIGFTPSPVFAN